MALRKLKEFPDKMVVQYGRNYYTLMESLDLLINKITAEEIRHDKENIKSAIDFGNEISNCITQRIFGEIYFGYSQMMAKYLYEIISKEIHSYTRQSEEFKILYSSYHRLFEFKNRGYNYALFTEALSMLKSFPFDKKDDHSEIIDFLLNDIHAEHQKVLTLSTKAQRVQNPLCSR